MTTLSAKDIEALKLDIISALRLIYDPEIPVNIYDLGLIYGVEIDKTGKVDIKMTLTTPGCPVAETFPIMVQNEINAVPGVASTHVEIVWDPPWTQEMMSEAAREQFAQMGMLY